MTDKIFELDGDWNLEFHRDELAEFAEFAPMITKRYNSGEPGDSQGNKRLRAKREFLFMFLMNDWQSIYSAYPKEERLKASMKSAGIDEAYVFSNEYKTAEKKYQQIKASNLYLRLLSSAQEAMNKLIDYFSTVTSADAENLQKNISNLEKTIAGLEKLEDKVKKELVKGERTRGDQETGFLSRNEIRDEIREEKGNMIAEEISDNPLEQDD